MINQQYLWLTFVTVISISILSGVLSYFQIPYQFYIWELFIDMKIAALTLLLLFLYKKNAIQISNIKTLLLNWSWKKNILYFFFPLLLFVFVIATGVLLKEITFNKLDNAPTLILATLFDIPAIFVFSVTSLLVEEIFFRGFVLTTIQQLRSQWQGIILTSLLWTVYCFSEIIGLQGITIFKFITALLFFFSIGILCSIIVDKYKSVWFGYSLRIGLITLSPILLTSLLSESDSFFTTESLLFDAEGVIFSILILAVSFILLKTINIIPKLIEEKIED